MKEKRQKMKELGKDPNAKKEDEKEATLDAKALSKKTK